MQNNAKIIRFPVRKRNPFEPVEIWPDQQEDLDEYMEDMRFASDYDKTDRIAGYCWIFVIIMISILVVLEVTF